MKKTFIFYTDWQDYTEEMSLEQKWLFLECILVYQKWWKPEPGDLKFIRSRVKKQLDEDNSKWEDEREKRVMAGKLWGKAKASKGKQVLASASKSKQLLADNVNVNVTVNDNVNENKKEITLSNDKEAKPVYWDPDINECLEIIKEANNWILDWTVKNNRRYWKLLIWKIKKIKNVENDQFSWSDYLKSLLQIIWDNTYYSGKIAGPEKIYRDLATLQQVANKEFKKKSSHLDIIPTL